MIFYAECNLFSCTFRNILWDVARYHVIQNDTVQSPNDAGGLPTDMTEVISHPGLSRINALSETNLLSLCLGNSQCWYSLKYNTKLATTITTVTCGHLKFHYKHHISPLVMSNQIWYVLKDQLLVFRPLLRRSSKPLDNHIQHLKEKPGLWSNKVGKYSRHVALYEICWKFGFPWSEGSWTIIL